MTNGKFEEEWKSLKKNNEHHSFNYSNPSTSARKIITAHFKGMQRQDKHGVYVIRQESTSEVLYVGKSGTVDQRGRFKDQNIPDRLKNVKGRVSSNAWFSSLVEEKGPLIIEYVFLAATPKAPALAEALLLQAYLNEHGCLPYCNRLF